MKRELKLAEEVREWWYGGKKMKSDRGYWKERGQFVVALNVSVVIIIWITVLPVCGCIQIYNWLMK